MSLRLLTLCCLVLAWPLAASVAAAARDGEPDSAPLSLRGEAWDGDSPAAGAEIRVYDVGPAWRREELRARFFRFEPPPGTGSSAMAPSLTALADEAGRFTVPNTKPGRLYVVTASRPGMLPLVGMGVSGEVVRLDRSEEVSLSVRAVEGRGRTPVPGAKVRVVHPTVSWEAGVTDAEGRLSFTAPLQVPWPVLVLAPGFRPGSQIANSRRETQIRLNPAPMVVSGQVRLDDRPVAGAEVWGLVNYGRWPVLTDEQGRFEVQPVGRYGRRMVTAVHGSFGASVAVEATPAGRSDLTIELQPAGQLVLMVRDAKGEPPPGAELLVSRGARGVLRRDLPAEGRVEVRLPPQIPHRIDIVSPNHATELRTVTLASGSTTVMEVDLVASPPLVVRLRPGSKLPGDCHVNLHRLENGKPARYLTEERPHAGEAIFTGAAPGPYVVYSTGCAPDPAPVELNVPHEAPVVLDARPAVITGRALDDFGRPYEGLELTLARRGGRERLPRTALKTTADAKGHFRFGPVGGGTWSLGPTNSRDDGEWVAVKAGRRKVVFRTWRPRRLVIRHGAEAVEGLDFDLTCTEGPCGDYSALWGSDRSGVTEMNGLRPGRYAVSVSRYGKGHRRIAEVDLHTQTQAELLVEELP